MLDMAFYEPFSWLLLVFFVLQFLGSVVRNVARKMDDLALFEAARVAFLISCELDSAQKQMAMQQRTVETADSGKRKRKKSKRSAPPVASADVAVEKFRSTPSSKLLSKSPCGSEADQRVASGGLSKMDSRGASELDANSAVAKLGQKIGEGSGVGDAVVCGLRRMLTASSSERSDSSRLSLDSTVIASPDSSRASPSDSPHDSDHESSVSSPSVSPVRLQPFKQI
jgi:hypothetical protein